MNHHTYIESFETRNGITKKIGEIRIDNKTIKQLASIFKVQILLGRKYIITKKVINN